ncbi:response regulator [Thermodesulfobacteriota bacterium]
MQSKNLKKSKESIGTIHPLMQSVADEKRCYDNVRILVVDDESCVREILSWVLNGMGFEVSIASNGFEAFGMFMQGSFELVLTDLNMPGMDGWLLAHKIKEKSPETAVMLVTGEEPKGVKEKLRERCVDSVLFKPFRIEEIESAVLRILDNG